MGSLFRAYTRNLSLKTDPTRLAFWGTLLAASAAVLVFLVGTNWPLGVQREWEWDRAATPEPFWLVIAPLAGAGLLYLGFVWLGSTYIERSGRWGLAAWLAGLVTAGFAWLWIAQESAPESFQLSKSVWVLYFRGSSGYFWEARYDRRNLREYLRDYSEEMRKGDVLHIGTHPPGLVVAFRGLIAAVDRFPLLADVALATQPDSVRSAFEALGASALPTTMPLSHSDRAVLWLAALIVQACAALAVLPLFGLARQTASRAASWRACAFWPTVPALALFLPKSDCLYPLLALCVVCLWTRGLDRNSPWRFALAGFVFWLGMTLSLAFLAIGFLVFVKTVVRALRTSPAESRPVAAARLRQVILPISWGAVGFAIPTLAAWLLLQLNLPAVWWLNYRNHSQFYAQFHRTWWKWLLANPIEFSIAVGVPLMVAGCWSIGHRLRSAEGGRAAHVWAWLITLGLLWISGKNMGEAARLWIFLTPFLPWFAAGIFETDGARTAQGTLLSRASWGFVLVAQLMMSSITVLSATGFHYRP